MPVTSAAILALSLKLQQLAKEALWDEFTIVQREQTLLIAQFFEALQSELSVQEQLDFQEILAMNEMFAKQGEAYKAELGQALKKLKQDKVNVRAYRG